MKGEPTQLCDDPQDTISQVPHNLPQIYMAKTLSMSGYFLQCSLYILGNVKKLMWPGLRLFVFLSWNLNCRERSEHAQPHKNTNLTLEKWGGFKWASMQGAICVCIYMCVYPILLRPQCTEPWWGKGAASGTSIQGAICVAQMALWAHPRERGNQVGRTQFWLNHKMANQLSDTLPMNGPGTIITPREDFEHWETVFSTDWVV